MDDADTYLGSGIAGLSVGKRGKRGECRVQSPLRAVDQTEIAINRVQIGIGDPRPFKLRQCSRAISFLPEQPPQFVVQDGFLTIPVACGQTFDERGAG